MKISRILLNPWMNHASTEINLNRINIFTGLQYQGKSAILESIQHALLGYSPRVPLADHDPELDQGEITLDIEGLGKVRRTVHPNGLKVEGWSGNLTAQQGALLRHLKVTDDQLAAALTTTDFIGLTAADQKRMIFSLVHLELTPDGLKEMIQAKGGNPGLLPSHLLDFATATPEIFGELYQDAFSRRRDFKRDLKKIEAALSGAPIPALPNGLKAAALPEAEALLGKLRAEKETLLRKVPNKGALKMQRDTIAQQRSRIEELRASLPDIEAISDEYASLAKEKKGNDKELREITIEIEEAQGEAARITAETTLLNQQIKKLAGFKGKCPILTSTPCPVPPEKIQKLREEMEAKVKKLTDQGNKLTLGIETAEGKRSTLGETHLRITGRMDEIETQKNTRPGMLQEIEELGAAVAETEKAISDIPDSTEIEAEISTLANRIAEGEKLIEKLRDYERAAKQIERQKQIAADTQAEVEGLEKLVEILGPQGIVKDLLASKIGPIEERANRILGLLTGGTHRLTFAFDPDFEIRVTIGDRTLPLRKLSHSQKHLLVGLCLQDALCQLTRLRFLVIDNAEMLDPVHRENITAFFDAVRDDYDQILVASTITTRGEDGKPTIPTPLPSEYSDTSLFYVEAGTVREIKE